MVQNKLGVAQDQFWRKWFEKLTKQFKTYETYTPNPKVPAVTGKFYARHEAADLTQAKQDLLDIISYAKKPLNERVKEPDTINHSYGWYNQPLIDIDPNDRRFNFRKVHNDNTTHMLKLAKDKSLQKPKFAGIPFKL